MTTTGPVMDQFIAMIEEEVRTGDAYGTFELIENALIMGVPSQEIPEAVVAWSWGGSAMDSERDAHEDCPASLAEWTRFNEGPESKWNDTRYLRERFPDAFKEVNA